MVPDLSSLCTCIYVCIHYDTFVPNRCALLWWDMMVMSIHFTIKMLQNDTIGWHDWMWRAPYDAMRFDTMKTNNLDWKLNELIVEKFWQSKNNHRSTRLPRHTSRSGKILCNYYDAFYVQSLQIVIVGTYSWYLLERFCVKYEKYVIKCYFTVREEEKNTLNDAI